jgi:predicted MFS family arabinose efflux permease
MTPASPSTFSRPSAAHHDLADHEREAIASVPPDRAAMGSGANNTAHYLGAACGITLFVIVATHTGGNLYAGWNAAALVAAPLTLPGAAAIALTGRSS